MTKSPLGIFGALAYSLSAARQPWGDQPARRPAASVASKPSPKKLAQKRQRQARKITRKNCRS